MDLTRYPEILKDLIDKAAVPVAAKLQIPLTDAQDVVFEVCEVIRRDWSGNNLYLPVGLAHDINKRDLEMYEAFNGTNHGELSKRFGITVRQVYERIALVSAAEFKRRQPGLFE
jgi:Mor family transcriptional regulator